MNIPLYMLKKSKWYTRKAYDEAFIIINKLKINK